MLKLQTPVTDMPCKVGISYDDKIMMLGSCFSDNIGKELCNLGFDVMVNPFGTLYNPISILNSVKRLISGELFSEDDCVQIGAGDERWCSFCHHTSFACPSKEEFLALANSELLRAREHYLKCSKVIITLGTSWCFMHVESGQTVSNCLKHIPKEFARYRLSVSEISEALRWIAGAGNGLVDCAPKQFIFTVSPIRHFKDGAHGNQISKSALLLGIEEFLERCPVDLSLDPFHIADYFPAYEIVMDELRDYRFYTEDMCHPSQQTVNYILERFLSWALPASEHPLLQENIRRFKQSSHIRPLQGR